MNERRQIDRRIESLDPHFQPIAREWLARSNDELAKDQLLFGSTARIVETLRLLTRQAALLASGATRVKVGWHNYGLGLDFLIFEPNGVIVDDGFDPRYKLCGEIAESLGCVWGGRWDIKPKLPGQQPDSGHIEWHPGFTLQQYLAARQAGLVTFAVQA